MWQNELVTIFSSHIITNCQEIFCVKPLTRQLVRFHKGWTIFNLMLQSDSIKYFLWYKNHHKLWNPIYHYIPFKISANVLTRKISATTAFEMLIKLSFWKRWTFINENWFVARGIPISRLHHFPDSILHKNIN